MSGITTCCNRHANTFAGLRAAELGRWDELEGETLSAAKTSTIVGNEGGYYAIKGFLYQFDKTLIEVISNPEAEIAFENLQDIDYDNYVLQVKHKETQKYAPYKIRKPVEGLVELFMQDPTKKLCLYCYFTNTEPRDWHLTLDELDSILSTPVINQYKQSLRIQFIRSFVIRFSEDYQKQFEKTIKLIRNSFSLRDDEEAVLYHAIFRSKLLDRSVKPQPQRRIYFQELGNFLEDAEVTIFQSSYSKYLTTEKYTKLIKRRYFTFSAPNIENFDRLFLIDCDPTFSRVDMVEIASRLARKYFRKDKSPQPFLAIRNAETNVIQQAKRDLFDKGVRFFDGTYFNGDRFRLEDLVAKNLKNPAYSLKIFPESELSRFVKSINLQEIYQFFVSSPVDLTITGRHIRLQLRRTEEVLRIIA